MDKIDEKYRHIVAYFQKHNPKAATELHYKTPFELIVAVVLSAQCTDKRINQVTLSLFALYPTPEAMAKATVDQIYEKIKSVSYPHNKAQHLKGLSVALVEKFNGKVPQTVEDLQSLPGVGRKTANVILAVIYNKPVMAVDTHVFRVSARIGLVKDAKTPLETEKQLVAHLSDDIIPLAHHWLILHGRYVCLARKPKCQECGIQEFCDYYQTHFK